MLQLPAAVATEREGHGAWARGEGSRERIGQGAKVPGGFYWPIRSAERIGPGAKRLWILFLSLTVEALQGKTCQTSLLSGEGRSLWAKILGGRGRGSRPWGIFLVSTKLDTFCHLTVQTAPCYVQSSWHNLPAWQTERQTYRQTDGIAIASTAL